MTSKLATLSTNISAELKKSLKDFCKRRGLKIQHVIERAIYDQLEDEIDLKAYHERNTEEEIPLRDVLKKLKK